MKLAGISYVRQTNDLKNDDYWLPTQLFLMNLIYQGGPYNVWFSA